MSITLSPLETARRQAEAAAGRLTMTETALALAKAALERCLTTLRAEEQQQPTTAEALLASVQRQIALAQEARAAQTAFPILDRLLGQARVAAKAADDRLSELERAAAVLRGDLARWESLEARGPRYTGFDDAVRAAANLRAQLERLGADLDAPFDPPTPGLVPAGFAPS